MNIAVLATSPLFPKVRKLVELFEAWGPAFPKHHKHTFYTTPSNRLEVSSLILGLPNCQVSVTLPTTIRSFPMDVNEAFLSIAKHETEREWFYLGDGTLPLEPDWIDRLQTAYDATEKPILGRAAYQPRRIRDASGIDRTLDGNPYIMEAAVYPACYLGTTKFHPMHKSLHHENHAGNERYANASLTDLIGDAGYAELPPYGSETVVLTRLIGTKKVESLLGVGPVPSVLPLGNGEYYLPKLVTPSTEFPLAQPVEEIVASFKVETPKPTEPKRFTETVNEQGKKVIRLGFKDAPPIAQAQVEYDNFVASAPAKEPLPVEEVIWENPPEAAGPNSGSASADPLAEHHEAILAAETPTMAEPLIQEVSLKNMMPAKKKKIKVPKRNNRAKFRHLVKPK